MTCNTMVCGGASVLSILHPLGDDEIYFWLDFCGCAPAPLPQGLRAEIKKGSITE